jgi:hypothetical protein
MLKKAYVSQMSYKLTDAEKQAAEKALIAFTFATKVLDKAINHIYVMLTPFKDNPDISPDEIVEFRAGLRRYRDKVIDNFNQFKIASFKSIKALQPFSMDTETAKLTKSYISYVDDLEHLIGKFSDLFQNLKDKDFVSSIVTSLTDIEKQCDQIKDLVEDRVKSHIQKDILGRTWMDLLSDELQVKMEDQMPKILELEQERNKQLDDLAHNNHSISNWSV